MPFSPTESVKNWDDVYQRLFKPIIEELKFGYKCERSEIRNGSFTKDIVRKLKTSYLVLADITDFNSNVMWELGVRHSLSQRTVMVAREDMIDQIPSDIKGYGVIAYPKEITGFTKFKEEITVVLEKIEKEPERGDNPVFDFLKIEDLILSSVERKQIIAKLAMLLTELFDNLQYAETFISKPPTEGSAGRLHRMPSYAINELLTTAYIPLDDSLHINLKLIQQIINNQNKFEDQVLFRHKHSDNIVKERKKEYTELKDNIVKMIPILKKMQSLIKSDRLEFSESSVIVFNKEHKKLLD